MKVKYIGSKDVRRIQLPVPYLTKSDTGAIVDFTQAHPVQELPDESAKNLIEICANEFELVEEDAKKKAKKGE